MSKYLDTTRYYCLAAFQWRTKDRRTRQILPKFFDQSAKKCETGNLLNIKGKTGLKNLSVAVTISVTAGKCGDGQEISYLLNL